MKKFDSERAECRSDSNHIVSPHSILYPQVDVENKQGLAVADNMNGIEERYTDTHNIENLTFAGKPVAKK